MTEERAPKSGNEHEHRGRRQDDAMHGTAQFRETQQRQLAEDREHRRKRELEKDEAEQKRAEKRHKIESERFDIRQTQAARASALNAAASFGTTSEVEVMAMAERFAKWIQMLRGE